MSICIFTRLLPATILLCILAALSAEAALCPKRFGAFHESARPFATTRYATYRADTVSSLEKMRNPETGLIRDKIQVLPDGSVKVINDNTSATNIALDLLNQIALIPTDPAALANVERVIDALERMPFHRDSGLIYSWYSTGKQLKPVNKDVSSVDNIHLALALWTLKETKSGTELGRRAGKLFDRMDFSAFYDPETGLMKGNLKFADGKWRPEIYEFSNLGSEARSIYSLTWALGLLKKKADPDFVKKSVASLKSEFFRKGPWEILRTWDGGAFQQMLPQLLVNEGGYSKKLARSFRDFSDYVVADGHRRGYKKPAAHSASNYGVDGSEDFSLVPVYEGKAGNPDLVSSNHEDLNDPRQRELWDMVYTPHAAFIAASENPALYEPVIEKTEKIHSGKNFLYRKGFGFMDGFHVKGPYKGAVVPVQISLDQGMILLALEKMRAGLSVSARALAENKKVKARLEYFYGTLEKKWAAEK